MDALPYYQWKWRDYRANRRVQRMPWQAKGLYRELLDEFWAEGSLPTDHVELAEICGCTLAEFDEFWPSFQGCWYEQNGRLFNAKMDEQRTAKDAERVAKAEAGRSGGLVSNSRTRAEDEQASAKQVLAEAKELQAQPDIAEQSRAYAEHTQKQSKASSRGKREGEFILPEWIDPMDWLHFEEHRARIRKKMTDHARNLAVKELDALRNKGHTPRAMIDQAILKGWQTFYEPSSYGKVQPPPQPKFTDPKRAYDE